MTERMGEAGASAVAWRQGLGTVRLGQAGGGTHAMFRAAPAPPACVGGRCALTATAALSPAAAARREAQRGKARLGQAAQDRVEPHGFAGVEGLGTSGLKKQGGRWRIRNRRRITQSSGREILIRCKPAPARSATYPSSPP